MNIFARFTANSTSHRFYCLNPTIRFTAFNTNPCSITHIFSPAPILCDLCAFAVNIRVYPCASVVATAFSGAQDSPPKTSHFIEFLPLVLA